MNNAPPKHPLAILQKIEFEEAVGPDDPRFVETEEARGSLHTLDRLAKQFGRNLATEDFFPPAKRNVLLFGHIGCGKSTELLHLTKKLRDDRRLYVVHVDVLNELDRNNLQYVDALMALANELIRRLPLDQLSVDDSAVTALQRWFDEHVKTEDRAKELVAQLEAGAKAEAGLPFLGKFFANFSAAAKTNATYKDSLRTVVRNTFTQFADAFNDFLRKTEMALQAAGKGERILFIVDGTDKMTFDDTKKLFIEDSEQLFAIDALMLYTAPISLKYDGIPSAKFSDVVLSVIKLCGPDNKPFAPGRKALREILLKRADASVFAEDSLIEKLVDFSGGHPRELLRLLALSCLSAEGDRIDASAVDSAIKSLAADFRYFLEPEDYALLVQKDCEREQHGGNDERSRRLLHRLALLEYNHGSWRRSHPVVRELEGYRRAKQAADGAQGAA